MRSHFMLHRTSFMILVLAGAASAGIVGCSDDPDESTGGSGGVAGNSAGTGGVAGTVNTAGVSGTSGQSGTAGTSGQSGTAGTSGQGGSAGTSGQGGAAGTAGTSGASGSGGLPGTSGPDTGPQTLLAPVGTDLAQGRDVFRFETFGNEGYWTRVLELPQGMKDKGFTPNMALAAGVHVDIDAVPEAIKTKLSAELAANPDPKASPSLNNPAVLEALVEANAVIGLPARNVKTLNGTLDIDPANVFAGESVGLSCAFCHSLSDGSVLSVANGGGIGKRVDGPTNHFINVGASVALARNSRAFYPTLALDLEANKHGSVSRKGPKSATNPLISKAPTEAEVDAYLNDPGLYPVGMFDDQPDGNGAPLHITPFFRADLAAPWGSEGSIEMLQNFNNLVFTALFDATDLLAPQTPPGGPTDPNGVAYTGAQVLLNQRGGPAGLEIIANYRAIIENDLKIKPYDAATNPNGYPYVGRAGKTDVTTGLAAGLKAEPSLIGIRVDQTKLLNLNGYLYSLHSPPGVVASVDLVAQGRALFRQQCTSCHNDDQSKFVPENIVPFNAKVEFYSAAPPRPDLFPGWDGAVAATRPDLAPVRDFPGTFDDKLIITEASNRGQPRGDALPLLMDLARKPSFLHDDSVKAADPASSLSLLFDPTRGATSPHPFFVSDAGERAALVAFLRSLDDKPLP